MIESASALATGHVNVGGFYKVTAGTSAPLVTDYEKILAAIKPELPELDWAVVRGRGYVKAVAQTSSMDLVLGGIDIEHDPGFKKVIQVVSGNLEELTKSGTILLFESEAKRLEVKANDSLTLSAPTYRGMANTMDVRVAAIAKDAGALSKFFAYLPNETLRALYQLKPGSTGAIQLYLKDYEAAPQVAARLREFLAQKGWRVMDADPQPYWMKLFMKLNKEDWTGQKLDVSIWSDEMMFVKQMLIVLQALTSFLLLILMLIVGAGIMSTMWIAIRERTREIGTLRAIGMQRRRVLRMFLTESFLLGLASTTLGSAVGSLVVLLINKIQITLPEAVQILFMNDRLSLSLHINKVIISIIVVTIITAIAALYPSIRAARLKPVTAMHHIG
jgi:ABC-type lipoprotein release transport system permease subunit